jgi:hypothetical protein
MIIKTGVEEFVGMTFKTEIGMRITEMVFFNFLMEGKYC